mmetsp:Transcript_29854/g.63322  ORF Transcript_29854/g.63322 Transcript_29854/m.63322 type:complete len:758 (-) Transcript_29854:1594-3867(-)|eukprot:CAMPEP_0172298506 /NCGR_PEP_ID=MMETSP1058-20130122/1131_1 /TAXON_ID=83371 /ORGANISM="Detonula confervacea, Strain CCMP 353" /LENGTH=757 /DNA_ID=CAMNT_0013007783 /DNA_START=156 /DNA_END=2429 /DNA_ORIENTATION=+
MGRYRRRHKHGKGRGHNGKQSQNGGDGDSSYSYSPQMSEADWMLVEKYLLEYRSRAYEGHQSKQQKSENQQLDSSPVMIGSHQFLPLTVELCKRPYIDLPHTLGGKERRRVHALCATLDLYHDSANTEEKAAATDGATNPTPKRRIVISIFADGLELVPNRGKDVVQTFPSHICRPWYYQAYNKSTNNNLDKNKFSQRMQTIELEKKQISKLVNLPEQSVRPLNGADQTFCDSLDFSVLDSLDLSMVPTPEETPWMLVDTVDKLKLCVDELMYGVDNSGDGSARSPKIHELAFDLEMHSVGEGTSRYPNRLGIRTCLIQLTSDVATTIVDEQSGSSKEVYKDYIVDPLAPGIWDAIPAYLGPLFADPNIVKIGQGIGGMDTTSLHRDFGILIINAFDTYEASTILSRSKGGMGLAVMCRHYGLPNWKHYKELKNKYQCSDWRKRPLDEDALEYGRYDIRYLVTLRKLLMRDLAKLDMLGSGEDDSGFESASTPTSNGETPLLQPIDSQLDSTASSTASSFSENEFHNTAVNNTLGQLKEASSTEVDSSDSQLPSASTKSIIHASEFPCYHHLMKAISTSQKRCLKLWTGDEEEPILRNASLLSMIKQAANGKGHGKHWSDAHMQLYVQLAKWRVGTARTEFHSVPEVCSLDLLVHVAYKLPKNRSEMRRYSHVLPALLEDKTLPYCEELCELVTSSDVFQRQQHPPLSETRSMDVVLYSDDCASENNQERQKHLFKLLVASTAIAVIAIAMTRARRR